jgi:hypothetical protein
MTTAVAGGARLFVGMKVTDRIRTERWRMFALPLHLAVIASLTCIAVVVFYLGIYEPAENDRFITLTCGLAVAGLALHVRYVLGLPWVSASMVFLVLFWMFHYGLTFTAALAPDVLAPFEDWEIEWLRWPNVRLAMVLALLGATGFVFGVGLSGRRASLVTPSTIETGGDRPLHLGGWVVMVIGLAGLVFTLMTNGGIGVLSMGYMDFRQVVLAPTRMQTFIDLSQLGCLMALCGADRGRALRPLIAWFAVAGVVMLLVGLRSEAMIPLVTFAVVLAHRGRQLPRAVLVAAVVAALVVLPAIRVARLVGLGNTAELSWSDVTPLGTVTELGGTLRAVKAYVDWIEYGDEYQLGAGYFAPIDRQLLVRVLGTEQIPFDRDVRVPSRDIVTREGAVGAAATGEAYYNFGAAGPFLFFAAVGLVFGWLERRAPLSPYACAVLGVVMFVFYFNIRGEWLPVPAQLGVSLAVVGACYLTGRISRAGLVR